MLTTKVSIDSACQECTRRPKSKLLDLMKSMWSLGSLDSSVFFHLFDAQIKPIKPMLLYASDIWGTVRLSVIESTHLLACKRVLCVKDKTPNHMGYGDSGKYPLYIDSTIFGLRYWFKLNIMPRFPKQVFIMMKTRLMDCMQSAIGQVQLKRVLYGFTDVWTDGVVNESTFLTAFKRKMLERFRKEWILKLSNSDRF